MRRRIMNALYGFLYRLFFRPEKGTKRRTDGKYYNVYMFTDWKK